MRKTIGIFSAGGSSNPESETTFIKAIRNPKKYSIQGNLERPFLAGYTSLESEGGFDFLGEVLDTKKNLDDLADDLMEKIFSYLDLSSIFVSRWVSHRWHHLLWETKLTDVRGMLSHYLNRNSIIALLGRERSRDLEDFFIQVGHILKTIQGEFVDDQIVMLTHFIRTKEGSPNDEMLNDNSVLLQAWNRLEEKYQHIAEVAPRRLVIACKKQWDRWENSPTESPDAVVVASGSLDDVQINEVKHYFLTYLALAILNLSLFKVFHEPGSKRYPYFLSRREVVIPIDDGDILYERSRLEAENASLGRRFTRTRQCIRVGTLFWVLGALTELLTTIVGVKIHPFRIVSFASCGFAVACILMVLAAQHYLKRSRPRILQFADNEQRFCTLGLQLSEVRERQRGEDSFGAPEPSERDESDPDESEQSEVGDYQQLLSGNASSVVSYGTFGR